MLATMVSLGSWNWFILAVILFVIELIAPGAFMLWLGIAAVLVGLISIGIEWSWQAQNHHVCPVVGRGDPNLAPVRASGRATGRCVPTRSG